MATVRAQGPVYLPILLIPHFLTPYSPGAGTMLTISRAGDDMVSIWLVYGEHMVSCEGDSQFNGGLFSSNLFMINKEKLEISPASSIA